jgi:glycosyltransferase involved in cell wall biosynthesis
MDEFQAHAEAAAGAATESYERHGQGGIPAFHQAVRAKSRSNSSPSVSVVIPTLNEARNLPIVLAELPGHVDEIVIVDGHSTDDTVAVARAARPDATVITQDGRGKGDALRCGFEAAGGDILVMMDADGSADPAEIPRFLEALEEGADFAKGTRFAYHGGSSDITRTRQAGNRLLSATVNILYGTSYTDLCYGYNAFWRRCLPTMRIDCSGFEVETLINIRIGRAGLNVTEVPSFERDRIHGESNLRTFRDGARVLRTIMRERIAASPREISFPHHHEQPHSQLDYATEGS